MLSNPDRVVVTPAQIAAYGDEVSNTSKAITDGAEQMTAQLERTLAEWGEGTASRTAFNSFNRTVELRIKEMNTALAKLPPAIAEAIANAIAAENRNAQRFQL